MTAGGGFADEAARLLAAAEGWLRNVSGGSGATLPAGVHELFAHQEEHAGDCPCQICPVCRLISAARIARPEVVEHLTGAATSLLLALRALTDPSTPASPPDADEPEAQRATVVQHITVN